MNAKNYTATITVHNTPEAAFEALTSGIANWWTKPDQPMLKIGDRSKFTFPPGKGYWIFEATGLEYGRMFEMECVEAFHVHEGMPKEIEKEWLGTKVRWQIEPDGTKTNITIVHQGLVPGLHCYEICEAGWNMFFIDSLHAYLETGVGKAHRASAG